MHRHVTRNKSVENTGYTERMNELLHTDFNPKLPSRRRLQTVLVLGLSLLLHLILFDWLSGRHGDSAHAALVDKVIVASLLPPAELSTPKPISTPTPAATETKPKPTPTPRTMRAAKPAPAITETATPPPLAPPSDDAITQTSQISATSSASSSTESTSDGTSDLPKKAAAETMPSTMAALRFAPPPSAELKYNVQALRDGKTVYGSGKISWQANGDRYAIDGEAGVLFFTMLNFKSEGSLDQQGITPLRYSEKRYRKSETNTHFQRDPKRISFSASTQQYPRNGGEQDRASIIWQLVAIGRADPAQFGNGLDIFVAGVRDGDTWHVQIVGEEQITVGGESITAWHLLRTPRADSFDATVDIWLAPTRDWYPVKLRQTERNGDYLDMSMSSITQRAALSAQ